MKRLLILSILLTLLMSGCFFLPIGNLSNTATFSKEEMLAMDDSDLYDALIIRFLDVEPETLNQAQRTVATLLTFDAEVMNGGLCQFFTNDYYGYAQYVSDALGQVGAAEMQKHYSDFLTNNQIDVTRMDLFHTSSIEDYLKQLERYPYESFDSTFYEIYQRENLFDLLLTYVRLHADTVLE